MENVIDQFWWMAGQLKLTKHQRRMIVVTTPYSKTRFYKLFMEAGKQEMLQVKKLDPRAVVPTVAHPGEDLAYDLYALEDVTLAPMKATRVRTGIAAMFTTPFSAHYDMWRKTTFGLLIRDRSSLAAKGVITSGGVIDAGYRGEIQVIMTSTDMRMHSDYLIKAGEKIAQMIPIPVLTNGVEVVEELPEAKRGANGFGSTGK